MIRDEFIKQQKEDSLSSKEIQKIRAMGERVFYTTQINKIISYTKVLNFSCIIVAIMVVLTSIPLILGYLANYAFSESVLVPTIIVVAFALAVLGWFFVIKPNWKKKLKKYQTALETLREQDIQKQKNIFKNYVK